MYNITGRIDPMNGEEPQYVVPSDYRNKYCIMGMVTIDRMVQSPLLFMMGEKIHDECGGKWVAKKGGGH